MIKLLQKLPRWVASVVVIAAVGYLTLWPNPVPDNDVEWFPHADKVVHALMFGAIWFALAVDLKGTAALTWRGCVWLAVFVASLGGLIEVLQSMMPYGRSGSWADWTADVAGILLALWFYRFDLRRSS